jgi:hypothetical protein
LLQHRDRPLEITLPVGGVVGEETEESEGKLVLGPAHTAGEFDRLLGEPHGLLAIHEEQGVRESPCRLDHVGMVRSESAALDGEHLAELAQAFGLVLLEEDVSMIEARLERLAVFISEVGTEDCQRPGQVWSRPVEEFSGVPEVLAEIPSNPGLDDRLVAESFLDHLLREHQDLLIVERAALGRPGRGLKEEIPIECVLRECQIALIQGSCCFPLLACDEKHADR